MQVLYTFESDLLALKAEVTAQYNGVTLIRKDLDLSKKEHEEPSFAAKTPLGKLPVLETNAGARRPHTPRPSPAGHAHSAARHHLLCASLRPGPPPPFPCRASPFTFIVTPS